MCEILSTKEQEALHEIVSLIRQIIVLLHKVLDIEQRLGFLTDAQHEKIWSDANRYDDMRAELVSRSKKQSSPQKATENYSGAILNESLISKSSMRRKHTLQL